MLLMTLIRFDGPIEEARKREFRIEQQCSIGFAGLKPIWRMFV